jgi:hypothetical protein
MVLDAASWSRPLPGLNLLITDDPAACEQRFTARTGQPVTADMRAFTRQALAVYEMLAQDVPAQWTVISRAGLGTDQVLAAMTAACDHAARTRAGLGVAVQGVTPGWRAGLWRATVKWRGACYRLGTFTDEQDAARAYDAKVTLLAGPYAVTNQKLGLYHPPGGADPG